MKSEEVVAGKHITVSHGCYKQHGDKANQDAVIIEVSKKGNAFIKFDVCDCGNEPGPSGVPACQEFSPGNFDYLEANLNDLQETKEHQKDAQALKDWFND